MKYGLPGEPTPEHKEDVQYPINFRQTGDTYYFEERWDRAVRWQNLGAFCLKIFDNDDGLVEAWIDEDTFDQVVEFTGTEPHDKQQMTEKEYIAWQRSQGGAE